ncbi:flagellar biosynthesis protein FlgE [Poseidonibacter parvus]|uniref:Flagellar biosynthesis protein FlgE n=1 Tax=Poseidonibacter parvus TaxID=1850254 RepID=A0A1P8KPI1_9BACT|nr:flagellar hook-basal body complex protein [Poseidonibacter parvus]APW66399.1 flagellar biosynthesis protein FlgE [Poseidonibacter parvus]
MIGALWTGISGLSSQQTALDNESNNIANVNTVGYKASRISFADQMYQDSIGKGSTVLDAEKLYTQGNLNLTGVDYDMALSGDGFFTVADKSASGTSENYYTRAGNFRMGDNGTLQDAAGNEVQGWPMSAIDSDNDVTSTNPNVSIFTNDYTKLLTSKIVEHSTYVETITAKATDYAASAMSDSESVFSGAGLKTKSAKISDVEAAISDYSNWLQKLKETPDGSSASSVTQMSEINFKTSDAESIISKEGDQIYVYIDGNKISQNYISTASDLTFQQDLYDNALSTADQAIYGDPSSGTLTETQTALYDKQASKIATYKALADKISEIPGLVAYMAKESGGITNDSLEETDSYSLSTEVEDMYKGMIQIKALIPGEEFTISEVGEISGNSTIQGDKRTSVTASAGSGTGALESSRDALAKLITGKQQDVYKETNLEMDGTSKTYTLDFSIFDKEIGDTIPIPYTGTAIKTADPITIVASTIDEFIEGFNFGTDDGTATGTPLTPPLTDYLEAVNINDSLVIRTKDANYEVDFSTSLKIGTDPLEKDNDLSGRAGAGAEFIEMVNTVNQTSSQDSLQLRLDTLGISDSAFGEFSVDSSGLITMTQDGAEFAIGQASIALFNNNIGLEARGDNLLAKTTDSGDPIYNLNNDKAATVEGQTLELSTADLSESLVNLMVFQRAFEANAKSITTADEILTTLIGLKR